MHVRIARLLLTGLLVLSFVHQAAGQEPDIRNQMRMPLAPAGEGQELPIRPFMDIRIEKVPSDKADALTVRASDAGTLGNELPVHYDVVAPGGKILTSAKAKASTAVTFSTKPWPVGPYEVRLTFKQTDYTNFYHLPEYKGDWVKQVGELLAEAEKAPAKSDRPEDLRIRLLAEMILDRLGGFDPRKDKSEKFTPASRPPRWEDIHSVLIEHVELKMGEAAQIRPHGFIRFGWRDEIDDSPQFARAYLPPKYDPRKKWPMLIDLHGRNGLNPKYINWGEVAKRHDHWPQRHNIITLEPHGRANSGYRGIGELDALKAIGLAVAKLSVDPDRVYLCGFSMGGGGTWLVGSRHPELFAAICPVAGGWDYHSRLSPEESEKLTPRRKFELECDSSFAQAEALLTTPIFVNHGDNDRSVGVGGPRYAVTMLQRWGYDIRYWEHPGVGHDFMGQYDAFMPWMLRTKLNRDPLEVRVRAGALGSAHAHWVAVTQRENPYEFIQARARIIAPNVIELQTRNVLQLRLSPGEKLIDRSKDVRVFRLSPGEILIDRSKDVRVFWNGADAGSSKMTDGSIVLTADNYKPAKVHKTPQVAGPISEVMATPFAIVVGTSSKDAAMRSNCLTRGEQMRQAWQQWQHVQPRYFLDSEITAEQIAKYSLVLIGGADHNLVTAKLADRIPLRIDPASVTIAGRAFEATDSALSMVWPHPLNQKRYVWIQAGSSAAGMAHVASLPRNVDYALTDVQHARREDGPLIISGRFDYNWRFDPKFAAGAALSATGPDKDR